MREIIAGYYQRYRDILARIIQQGIETEEFTELDPEKAAHAIMALVEGLLMIWFVAPNWVELEGIGDMPLQFLLDGFRRRKV